jgi:hypothetical protein
MRFFLALLGLFASTLAYSADRVCTVSNVSMRCGDATESVRCDGYADDAFILDHQKIESLKIQGASNQLFFIRYPHASIRDYRQALADYKSGNFTSSNASPAETAAIADLKHALGSAKPAQLSIVTFGLPRTEKLYESCHSQDGAAKPADLAENGLTPPPVSALLAPTVRDSSVSLNRSKNAVSVDLGGQDSGSNVRGIGN